ncbi:amino acid permease, partial [Aureobasidium melanogenum]
IQSAGIPALPSIINAVILTSASSSANAFLFSGSRYLFALAQNGQAPKVFLKCSKNGVPYYAVLLTASISLLTYMSVSSGASTVFNWFQNLCSIANLITWISILIAYIQFRKALIAQGVDRNSLVMKSKWQPWTAYISLAYFCMILLFNGFAVFTKGNWSIDDFITAYIGIPIYIVLYLFWKVFKREPFVKPAQADIWTGKAAMDAEYWPEQQPRNFIEKIWFWIA